MITFDNVINAGTLIALLTIGTRLMRHANRMEFRVDQMWEWFQARQGANEARRERERRAREL
jgi:hypothetical protein